jgi:membrane-associated phospholipid phosphatase
MSLLRPRTYIRRVMDPNWEPLIPTPPFPEYPSGHSGISAAAAEVLTAVFGDTVAFRDSTGLTIGSSIREFKSFREAAHEAGMSRLYGGIHFQYGNLGGRSVGECVGAHTVERLKATRAR